MKRKAVILLGCILMLCGVITALSVNGETIKTDFIPPPFELNAESGIPENAGDSWVRVHQDGMGFSSYVCGEVIISDGKAEVWFTNDASNAVWMKLRVMDAKGKILGETGLLRPDEYVRSVVLEKMPRDGAEIEMKIMAYEPETYYSAGAVSLHTTVRHAE